MAASNIQVIVVEIKSWACYYTDKLVIGVGKNNVIFLANNDGNKTEKQSFAHVFYFLYLQEGYISFHSNKISLSDSV